MEVSQTDGGILVPKETKDNYTVDTRNYGRIELHDKESRKLLQSTLSKLLNTSEVRHGSISIGIAEKRAARREIILQFAFAMLGNDFSYEGLC